MIIRRVFGIIAIIVVAIWIIAQLHLEAVVGTILAIVIMVYGLYLLFKK